MFLPSLESAELPQSKVTDYLLSPSHLKGRAKAVFFNRFGFKLGNWEALRTALLQHAAENEIAESRTSVFGMCYVIDGALKAPDGRKPRVRAIWFIERDEKTPRFVTAYPLPIPDEEE